jgi:hypothetical protein
MFLKIIILASILFAIRDWYIIEVKKKVPNHGKGFTMRLVISAIICLVVAKDNNDLIENFIVAPWIVWFVFQYGLNILRDKKLTYLSPESSKLDGFLLRIFKKSDRAFVFLLVMFLGALIFKTYGL